MILLFIYIILIIFAFIAPKSKFVAIILFLYSFLLLSLNTQNPDSNGYMNEYELAKYDFDQLLKLEIGHYYLMKVCNQMGLNFYQYKFIVATIIYVLLYCSICKITKYSSFIAGIYLLCYLPTDVVQYRNILAFSIVFFGTTFFLFRNNCQNTRTNYFCFVVTIVFATIIHLSSFFYLLLLLAGKGVSKRVFVVLMAFSVILSSSLFVIYNNYFDVTLKDISSYENQVRPISVVFYSLFQCISCYYLYKINQRMKTAGTISNVYNFIFYSNLLLSLLLPLFIYDTNFLRLFKFWHLPTIILLSNILLPKRNLIGLTPVICYVLFWLWSMSLGTVKIYGPVFYNNMLVQ